MAPVPRRAPGRHFRTVLGRLVLAALQILEILPSDRVEAVERAWAGALRGQRHRIEWPTLRADRRPVLDIGPAHESDGLPTGGMMLARDVTETTASALPAPATGVRA